MARNEKAPGNRSGRADLQLAKPTQTIQNRSAATFVRYSISLDI